MCHFVVNIFSKIFIFFLFCKINRKKCRTSRDRAKNNIVCQKSKHAIKGKKWLPRKKIIFFLYKILNFDAYETIGCANTIVAAHILFFRLCHVYFLGTQEWMNASYMWENRLSKYLPHIVTNFFFVRCSFSFPFVFSPWYMWSLFFKFKKKKIHVLILYVICCYQLSF